MCKITAAQIQSDGKAVGTALENIAAALPAAEATIAAELKTAGRGIIAATANWQEGSATAVVEDAENAAIVALNLIPVTSPFAPLVAIAFAAINLLLANSQTQTTQTGNVISDAHTLLAHAATLNQQSHWAGKAKIKHHFLNPPRKDFETAFNGAAAPLGVALITV
jgi:Flp pilus assembly protein TadG